MRMMKVNEKLSYGWYFMLHNWCTLSEKHKQGQDFLPMSVLMSIIARGVVYI